MIEKIKATELFEKNLNATAKVVINRGGAGSSKSYSLMQLFLFKKFFCESNNKILVTRKTFPSLRASTYQLFNDMIDEHNLRKYIQEDKSSHTCRFNQNLLHFSSLDDPEKLKSAEYNYIWMEEATEFSYKDYQILKLRLRAKTNGNGRKNRLFMSFNPIDAFHWIKTKVIEESSEEKEEIISTYHDNPFLQSDYIESLKALEHQDKNYYRIYALGEWGRLENLIYSNWQITKEMPENGDIFYGLDFGMNSPSALIKIIIYDDIIYEQEILYKSGLTNSDLIEMLKARLPNPRLPIYADSSEPNRIEEIYRAGFNIMPADKSVNYGIDFVKRQKINIHEDSINLIKERRAYSWRVDKNGNLLNEPVKFSDHLMDAERYAIYTHCKNMSHKPVSLPKEESQKRYDPRMKENRLRI